MKRPLLKSGLPAHAIAPGLVRVESTEHVPEGRHQPPVDGGFIFN